MLKIASGQTERDACCELSLFYSLALRIAISYFSDYYKCSCEVMRDSRGQGWKLDYNSVGGRTQLQSATISVLLQLNYTQGLCLEDEYLK